MAEPVAATFRKPFDAQVAAWRLRLQELRPSYAWDQYEGQAHDRAFMVAGATKADLLADLAAAVGRAIEDGTGIEAFRRDFREITDRLGWPGKAGLGTERGFAWRTRVIYRTNMRSTYMAGRRAQLADGQYRFWVYRHSGAAEPRLDHLAWDGVALPPDHPFWATHYPPNGWGCGCTAEGARTEAGVKRLGGDPGKALPEGWDRTDPRTGVQVGIDRGWDHASGADVAEEIVATLGRKLPTLPAPIGADLALDLPLTARDEVGARFGAWVDEVVTGPPRGRSEIVGALKPEWVAFAEANGVVPVSAEIAVNDDSVLHAFRDAKANAVDFDWYRRLPEHLRNPDRVLLDARSGEPAFLLIYEAPAGGAKLVVRIDYRIKRRGRLNAVRTATRLNPGDIEALLGSGVVEMERGGPGVGLEPTSARRDP